MARTTGTTGTTGTKEYVVCEDGAWYAVETNTGILAGWRKTLDDALLLAAEKQDAASRAPAARRSSTRK